MNYPITITLATCGDIMVHGPQIEAAAAASGVDYDFFPQFLYVAPLFKAANLAFCNLETTFSGKDAGYKGYPNFNSPEQLARDLVRTGFSLVTTANNHSPDYHEHGIVSTLDFLDKAGLRHTGTARCAEERNQPCIMNIDGMRIGFCAYTYGTNNIPIPEDKKYLLNFLRLEEMTTDIAALRACEVDVVICCPHFGAEYTTKPDATQQELVHKLWESGVDIVIGNHSHIIQPAEWDRANNKFAVYSLGNFISNQKDPWTDTGAVLNIQLRKANKDAPVEITDISIIPTYVYKWSENNRYDYRILPLTSDEPVSCGFVLPDELRGRRSEVLQRLWEPLSPVVITDR
jgi:poly-gamma-glutamate capsule biosynthesis protein CapA/YwtB (metallophosphatase superfamily)